MKITHTKRRSQWLLLGLSMPVCVVALAGTPRPPPLAPATSISEPGAGRLIQAVQHGDFDAVRALAGSGSDMDAAVPGEGSALIVAARRGDLAMVDTLLSLGADKDKAVHGDGNPLIAASAAGQLDVMAHLLKAGADVDAVVPGDETALISAVRSDRQAAVELLVSHGANVNLGAMANNNQWRSPLNQARSEVVRRYLLQHGAATGHPQRTGA